MTPGLVADSPPATGLFLFDTPDVAPTGSPGLFQFELLFQIGIQFEDPEASPTFAAPTTGEPWTPRAWEWQALSSPEPSQPPAGPLLVTPSRMPMAESSGDSAAQAGAAPSGADSQSWPIASDAEPAAPGSSPSAPRVRRRLQDSGEAAPVQLLLPTAPNPAIEGVRESPSVSGPDLGEPGFANVGGTAREGLNDARGGPGSGLCAALPSAEPTTTADGWRLYFEHANSGPDSNTLRRAPFIGDAGRQAASDSADSLGIPLTQESTNQESTNNDGRSANRDQPPTDRQAGRDTTSQQHDAFVATPQHERSDRPHVDDQHTTSDAEYIEAEPLPSPPPGPKTLTNLAIRLEDGGTPVDIRLRTAGNAVEFAIRTPDSSLSQAMERGLPYLERQMGGHGFNLVGATRLGDAGPGSQQQQSMPGEGGRERNQQHTPQHRNGKNRSGK